MNGMSTIFDGAKRVRRLLAVLAASGCVACGPSSAQADLQVVCDPNADLKVASESKFDYSGGADGTLKVTGFFGDMQLKATRKEQTSTIGGETFTVFGIKARGPANVRMPEKAKIETCLAKKVKPNDPDLVYHTNLCQLDAPLSATPSAIVADITITVVDPPIAEVYVTRQFTEETTAIGKGIMVETLPPLQCKVTSAAK